LVVVAVALLVTEFQALTGATVVLLQSSHQLVVVVVAVKTLTEQMAVPVAEALQAKVELLLLLAALVQLVKVIMVVQAVLEITRT
jgi:hypothetical protein